MVATRVPLRMIVLVNAMIPLPGEKPGDWWGATGALEARLAADEDAGRSTDFDVERHFLHDVPEDVQARMFTQSPPREPADTPFAQPCEFERWPDIPVRVLVGTDDRFFPAEFQRRVAMDRLAVDVDEIEAGHLVALSNPTALGRPARRLPRRGLSRDSAGHPRLSSTRCPSRPSLICALGSAA